MYHYVTIVCIYQGSLVGIKFVLISIKIIDSGINGNQQLLLDAHVVGLKCLLIRLVLIQKMTLGKLSIGLTLISWSIFFFFTSHFKFWNKELVCTKGIKVTWSWNIVHALDKVDFLQPNDYFVLPIWKWFKWMVYYNNIQ